MIVDKDTKDEEIDTCLRDLLNRNDIGIIIMSQTAAKRVRNTIVEHEKVLPTILEIPSKETPYEATEDPIVIRAAGILWG